MSTRNLTADSVLSISNPDAIQNNYDINNKKNPFCNLWKISLGISFLLNLTMTAALTFFIIQQQSYQPNRNTTCRPDSK